MTHLTESAADDGEGGKRDDVVTNTHTDPVIVNLPALLRPLVMIWVNRRASTNARTPTGT